MKELTIEQKAKAYDEALAKIRKGIQLLQDGSKVSGVTKGFLEEVFPELAESENEGIRKELITHCKNIRCVTEEFAERKAKWIAWLEKQGEHKLAWSEEDEHRVKETIYFLDTAKKHYASVIELDACIDWLKSLKQRIGE